MAKRETYKSMFMTEWFARSKSMSATLNAMRFVIEYGRACDLREGQPLTIDEYAAHVGVSLSQAYRRQAAFRTCSPKQDEFSVWDIVGPILDASNFKTQSPRSQAIFGLSIVATWNVP
jgi:hypothetical protein